jgi:hypothetical protein
VQILRVPAESQARVDGLPETGKAPQRLRKRNATPINNLQADDGEVIIEYARDSPYQRHNLDL